MMWAGVVLGIGIGLVVGVAACLVLVHQGIRSTRHGNETYHKFWQESLDNQAAQIEALHRVADVLQEPRP